MSAKSGYGVKTLATLNAQDLSAMADPAEYRIGQVYFREGRARIVEGLDAYIVSLVRGHSGSWVQCIALNDGALETRCSCPLSGSVALCRHAIAALLAYQCTYHLQDNPCPKETAMTEPLTPLTIEQQPISVRDLSLGDITAFLSWMPGALSSLECGLPLPDSPARLSSGQVRGWAEAFQRLETRLQSDEERKKAVVLALDKQKEEVAQAVSRLYWNLADSYEAAGDIKRAQEIRQKGLYSPS